MIFQKTKKPTQKTAPPRPNLKQRINAILLQAAEDGDLEAAQETLRQGADVNTRDSQGRTPLMLALIESKSDDPLDEKAIRASAERFAMRFGGEPKAPPLLIALLKAGAQVNLTDKKEMSALLYGVAAHDLGACQELLRYKANIHYETKVGISALGQAAYSSDLEIVNLLLKAGANPNVGKVPILFAAMVRLAEKETSEEENLGTMTSQLASALLGQGSEQTTGVETVVERLLQVGADPNQAADQCLPPLYLAAKVGTPRLVRMLLARGAKLEASWKNEGVTPLLDAVYDGRADTARVLLEAGANPNVVGREGMTPLLYAVQKANYALVEILLKAGAKKESRNDRGQTARDLAVAKRHTAIVQLLDLFKPS